MSGFEDYPTPVLEGVRANLLRGLDLVASHVDAGTFHTIPAGKASPPCQSGHLTLILLHGVDAELERRNEAAGGCPGDGPRGLHRTGQARPDQARTGFEEKELDGPPEEDWPEVNEPGSVADGSWADKLWDRER